LQKSLFSFLFVIIQKINNNFIDATRLFIVNKKQTLFISDNMDPKTFLPICLGVLLLWLLVALGLFPISLPTFLNKIILIIPFIGIILFGFYSLFYLAYKVVNLKDCPQAQIELQREVDRIKRDPRYQSLFRTTR
jgi:amino acid transporter